MTLLAENNPLFILPDRRVRTVLGVVGVFMLVAGLALIGLGFGYVKGSFMTGDVTIWIGIGMLTASAVVLRLSLPGEGS